MKRLVALFACATLLSGCAVISESAALRASILQDLTEPRSAWAAGADIRGRLVRTEAVDGFKPRATADFQELWFIRRGGSVGVYEVENSSDESGKVTLSIHLLRWEKVEPNQPPEPMSGLAPGHGSS